METYQGNLDFSQDILLCCAVINEQMSGWFDKLKPFVHVGVHRIVLQDSLVLKWVFSHHHTTEPADVYIFLSSYGLILHQ